jgi:site-specific recombinase XerD
MSIHVNDQEKVNTLSELVDYYEVCNKAEGKSHKTIIWYSANLRRFRNYLERRHLPDSIDGLGIKLLREYVLYLLKRNRFENHPYTHVGGEPLSSATIHGHVRTLRTFFRCVHPAADIGALHIGNGKALCESGVKRCRHTASEVFAIGPLEST